MQRTKEAVRQEEKKQKVRDDTEIHRFWQRVSVWSVSECGDLRDGTGSLYRKWRLPGPKCRVGMNLGIT